MTDYSLPIETDLRNRFCGLNADWSVDAWHYGPSDKPNMTSGDLYVYDNEGAGFQGKTYENLFTVAVVHYNDFTGDTIITPLSDHRTLSDAHNAALALVAKRNVVLAGIAEDYCDDLGGDS